MDNSSANGSVGVGEEAPPLQFPYSLQVSLGLVLLVAALVLLTVLGNVLVVLAILGPRGAPALRAPQHLLLVSLAVADLLVALLLMPLSLLQELLGGWPLGRASCRAYLALDVLLCTSSIAHLCAVALDRYCAVTRPAPGRGLRRTPGRVRRVIAALWLAAGLISCPPLLLAEEPQLLPLQEATPPRWARCEVNTQRWYVVSSCIGSFFLPCGIMVLVYLRIYHIARQRSRRRGRRRSSGSRRPAVPPPGHRGAAASLGKSNGVVRGEGAEEEEPRGEEEEELEEDSANLEESKEEEEEEKEEEKEEEEVGGTRKEEKDFGLTLYDLKVNKLHDPCSPTETEEEVGGAREEEGQVQEGAEAAAAPPRGSTRLCLMNLGCNPPAPQQQQRQQQSGGGRGHSGGGRGQQLQREARLTLVLALVLGVFVLCWFPFFFSYTLLTLCPPCAPPVPLFKFFFWFGYCNSALNPLIYTLCNRDFRTAFRRILCRVGGGRPGRSRL